MTFTWRLKGAIKRPRGFSWTMARTSTSRTMNLDLASQPEWKQYRAPHVSGYIEEMAHNFVYVIGAEFGWEMAGWSIGAQANIAPALGSGKGMKEDQKRRQHA